jgi:hypothetical protein
MTMSEEFSTFKGKIEIEYAVLRSEQSQIIYKSEQNVCKLTNENLHLKSRVNELEIKVFLRNKYIPS